MFCYCWGPGEIKSCKLRLSTAGILPHSCYVASGAFPWALLCWPNVLGAHLELEQTSTKTIPLHWLQQGLAPSRLGERSHTRNCTGMVPGFKTEKASYVDRLSTRDSWVLSFICFPRDTWQPALVRSLHFSTPLLPCLFHTSVRSGLAVHGLLLPRGMLLQHLTQLQTSNRGASDNYFYIYRF